MAEAALALPALARPGFAALQWFRSYLPEGTGLPQREWHLRHRAVVVFIFAHAVGLAIFGLARGWSPAYALGETSLIALLGGAASLPHLNRKMRSSIAALACVLTSAVLTQFWGGVIEAHFHFFVVVALIALYQDWAPFLVAVGFVALDHGLVGTLEPTWVYNHPAALANPWGWAVIHAVLVLAESAALVVVWKANEQSRAETDRVLRSAGEGLLGIDSECLITFANPAALAMLGLNEQGALGKPLYKLLVGDDGRPVFAGPEVLRQNPGAFTLEACLARPAGLKLPVEVLCNPIEGRLHNEGAVVALRDMSERVRAEEARTQTLHQEKQVDQLRQLNHFKSQFLNMAAHELNTPLTPIRLQLHLLKQRSAQSGSGFEPERKSIHMIDRNFQRLEGLVQELLDSTKLQSQNLRVERRTMDLSPVLLEVAETFRPLAQDAGVEFGVSLGPDLECHVDGLRYSQVLYNLITNAIKFTPSGGEVQLRAKSEDGHVRIEVRDTGPGLDPSQIARLFQPFSQVHESQVAGNRGSGLGLYVSRGIMELHNGRLWVESDGPGKGSTFITALPKTAPTVPLDEAAVPAA